MPDFVSRVAFNPVKAFHVDVGGILRVFRHHLTQFDKDFRSAGGGISINSRLNPAAATKLMLQWAYGPGLGRYIGGMVPDVAIRANGEIDPIDAGSWMTGIEQKVSKSLTLSGLLQRRFRGGELFSGGGRRELRRLRVSRFVELEQQEDPGGHRRVRVGGLETGGPRLDAVEHPDVLVDQRTVVSR